MLIHYLLALGWAILLTFSLLGWGHTLRVVLRVSTYCPPGADIALGMVVAVVVGGLLNGTATASRPVLLGFVIIGVLLGTLQMTALVKWILHSLDRDGMSVQTRFRLSYLVLVSLVVVITAFASVRGEVRAGRLGIGRFNPHDDFYAYLVYPERMLQTGTIGSDPFNGSRLSTGLSGQSILLAMARVGMPFESLHLVEPGIGTLAVLLTLLALSSVLGVGWGGAILVTLIAAAYPLAIANVSALTTGMTLMLLLAVLFAQWPVQRRPPGLLLVTGITVGAACALKTTSLMPVAAFVVLFFCMLLLHERMHSGVFREAVETGLVALAALLPWMVSLYRSSGTFLFPIFGSGFIGEAKPIYALLSKREMIGTVIETVSDAPAIGVAVVGAALIWSGALKSARGRAAVALCGAALVWLAMAAGLLAGTVRYAQGAISCAVIVGIAVLIAETKANKSLTTRARLSLSAGIAGAAIIAGGYWKETRTVAAEYARSIMNAWKAEPFDTPAYRDRYSAMQSSIERDASVLVRIERPFLLNFRKQQVFVVDWPGGASLPPGLPLRRGSDALAHYLLNLNIRFVAYDYAQEAGFSRKQLGRRLDSSGNAWSRSSAENTFAFQDLLSDLAQRYAHVYDDGQLWAIDLTRPLPLGHLPR